MKTRLCIVGFLFICLSISAARAEWKDRIKELAMEGTVYAVSRESGVLFEHQADKPLIPASVIKLITASAAFEKLGLEYRFRTDFFVDQMGNLYIKGYGDPMLISEEWKAIARSLERYGLKSVRYIFVDNSFFSPKIEIPGGNDDPDPYNAPVSALAANFNTIRVHVRPDGTVTSKERQTPMTDFAREAALRLKIRGTARVNLGQNGIPYELYPGHLLRAFLERIGIPVEGKIRHGDVPSGSTLLYRHPCRDSLEEVVRKMLKYSSNFMANQIFLTLGAKAFGQPATMEKGQRAVSEFLAESLDVKNAKVMEGSGLSRMNRVTARQMDRVLKYFWPHRRLLPKRNGMRVKTGTLSDVKASAGYFTSHNNGPVRLVVIINNCPRHSTKHRIINLLKKGL
ncbi:MAG: D-alanyl-D-alanine carboxypeptidase [Deltaproteobacteria bacterium]|nr:D-alanyl-D-alanine carboxypeptidase [Deltaproteobacteria bacterium]MBW2307738.1 D-alanyl-D-alanine carboxypeptidase [Deltaproteobacteria bacterium]